MHIKCIAFSRCALHSGWVQSHCRLSSSSHCAWSSLGMRRKIQARCCCPEPCMLVAPQYKPERNQWEPSRGCNSRSRSSITAKNTAQESSKLTINENNKDRSILWSAWRHLESLKTAIVRTDAVSEQSCRRCSWTGREKPTKKLKAQDGLPFNSFSSKMSFPIHSTRSYVRVAGAMSMASKISHFLVFWQLVPIWPWSSFRNSRKDESSWSSPKIHQLVSLYAHCPEHLCQTCWPNGSKPATPPSAPPEIFSNFL